MRPEDNPQNWHQEKTYESLMTYGANSIKFVLVVNGGAILSILTFIGHNPEKAEQLLHSVFCFVLGVLASGLANITAYLTQLALYNERGQTISRWKNHKTWLRISIGLLILGLIFFAAGSLIAVFSLTDPPTTVIARSASDAAIQQQCLQLSGLLRLCSQ